MVYCLLLLLREGESVFELNLLFYPLHFCQRDEGYFLVGHRRCGFQTPCFDGQNFRGCETQFVGRRFADPNDSTGCDHRFDG